MSTRRIQYGHQWTVDTKSDHKALFVFVYIRKAKSAWVPIIFASVNAGGHFGPDDLRMLFSLASGYAKANDATVIFGMQEASDQHYIEAAAKRAGYRYLASKRGGGAATPLLVPHEVEVRHTRIVQLLGRVLIGPGAGPDRSKAKWAMRNRLVWHNVPLAATSAHASASQQNKGRMRAALTEGRHLLPVLLRRIPSFVLWDSNSDQDQPFSAWLRRHGITSNHDQLGEIATHGTRSIDAVDCRRSLCAKPVKS